MTPSSFAYNSLSAAGAFAETFAFKKPCPASGSWPTRTSIVSLPVEILLFIFKLVHRASLSKPPTNPLSPHLFPYAVASVSAWWKEITLSVPAFWTQIVVVLGSPASLSVLTSLLMLSRSLPIDVVVTRGEGQYPVESAHERMLVASLVKEIAAHMSRCRSLKLSVMFSSSLPSFPAEFVGKAPILEELCLECRTDNGGKIGADQARISHTRFRCPSLSKLTIDGRNYYNACRKNFSWRKLSKNINDLTISRFTPNPGESLTPQIILRPLLNMPIEKLRLVDLAMDSPRDDNLHLGNTVMRDAIMSLELEDLQCPGAICKILDLMCYTYSVRITRCVLVEDMPLFAYGACKGRLILEDIDICHDLEGILRVWLGGELHVRNCPGFNDTILDTMTIMSREEFKLGAATHTLKISDCPNFSVPKLKRTIEVRRANIVPPGIDLPSGHILELAVAGDVPRFTSQERRWFIQNLQKFSYHETA